MVSDVSGLTDRELDAELAASIGGRAEAFVYNGLPFYSKSIDALQAVEARLREADLRQEVVWQPAAKAFHAEWGHFRPWSNGERFERWTAFNASESRARAEAALSALRAIAEPPDTSNRTNWPTSITTLASREMGS